MIFEGPCPPQTCPFFLLLCDSGGIPVSGDTMQTVWSRTYAEIIEVARICASKALLIASEDEATELWRMARNYQHRAAALEGNNRPNIGEESN
jgi:hypothetical protein